MQTVMAMLATALMLTFLEFGVSTADAQAGSAFCRHRYNVCLARCAESRDAFPLPVLPALHPAGPAA
jgi:hypothetical protein